MEQVARDKMKTSGESDNILDRKADQGRKGEGPWPARKALCWPAASKWIDMRETVMQTR